MRSSVFSSPEVSSRGMRNLASVVVVAALALGGCSSGASGTATPAAASMPTVTGAWVRPPQGMDRPAAGYFVVTGGSQADALISASSPAAGSVELHETTADASGMMGMHAVPRIEIPAGGTVTFQPGGFHLMLMQPTGTFDIGSTVKIDLVFEHAGTVTVQAEVKQG